MRKQSIIMVLALAAMLCGCGRNDSAGTGASEENSISNETGVNAEDSESLSAEGHSGGNGMSADDGEMAPVNGNNSGKGKEAAENGGEESDQGAGGSNTEVSAGMRAAQEGPFGEISVLLPDGWRYETFPMDSEGLISGDYGMHFCPESAAEGFIELAYSDFFGVCGTGLAQEDGEIAGSPVSIGTYDSHAYWDFVRFKGQNDGVVALTCQVEDWWEEYGDAVTGILDTLIFDRDEKEGGAYVFHQESENRDIGLYFSLKNISAAGATLVLNQFDADAPTGELQDGDDFIVERYGEENWEEVPVAVEGNYGFHDIAYWIPKEEITERELSWEWLYGQLTPGEYRIGKRIADFRETADYDEYVIYAYFILE